MGSQRVGRYLVTAQQQHWLITVRASCVRHYTSPYTAGCSPPGLASIHCHTVNPFYPLHLLHTPLCRADHCSAPWVLFVHLFFLNSTYKWGHMIFFFPRLTYIVSIKPSRPIYVVTNGMISSFYGWAVFQCGICSSTDGQWGCSHILAIVNNVAMNTEVHA